MERDLLLGLLEPSPFGPAKKALLLAPLGVPAGEDQSLLLAPPYLLPLSRAESLPCRVIPMPSIELLAPLSLALEACPINAVLSLFNFLQDQIMSGGSEYAVRKVRASSREGVKGLFMPIYGDADY